MKKQRTTIILVMLLIISSLVFLYPDISDYWNSMRQTRVISNYEENMDILEENEYEQILALAQEYNEELALLSKNSYENGEPVDEYYQSMLNLNDSNMMGYITIEKIDIDLPIYHGTSESVLSIGTGHLEGSSLPIGGDSTHTVITGHRGLATSMLFTDLDKLELGDTFTLTILSQTLTYEIDQILIVEPEEVDKLSIVDGEDYCTLITCTPFGVNTHRILVRGTRTDNLENDTESIIRVTPEAILIDPMLVVPFIVLPIVIVLLAVLFFTPSSRKGTRKGKSYLKQ